MGLRLGLFGVFLAVVLYYTVRDSSLTTPNLAMTRGAALFVTHGGGPLPLLGEPQHAELVEFLQKEAPQLLGLKGSARPKPKGLIVVSAHWETSVPHVSSRESSKLLYDYGGFPPETYKYTYNASGSKEVASKVADTIKSGGFDSVVLDSARGWDHGVFVPLLLIAPDGLDIPLIEVSILQSQAPADLIKLGAALAPLRDEGYAILGSGSSFHNFDGFFASPAVKAGFRKDSLQFEEALNAALTQPLGSPVPNERDERLKKLLGWQKWDGASRSQPPGAQDHFSPLVVLAGTLQDEAAHRAKLASVSELPASFWVF